MQKAGKFYKKLGIPEGSSFPTESYVAVGDLFYRTDEDIAYCYTLSGWASILASGDGVSNFLSLTDTPSTYAGVGGYKATVKLDETGLEFTATVSGEVSNFVDLLDVPDSYTTFSGYYASVKGDETGLEFTLPPVWKDVRIVAKDGALYTSIVTAYTDAPSGTTILLMPGTYDGDSIITIPDGITIKGVSRDNCIIDAEIRVEDGGITYLENVSVVRSGSPTYAVRPYSTTGTHYFINVRVDVTSSTNSSSCFYLNSGGSVFLINCEGTISGAGDPQYGVWQASAGTSWVIGGRFHGATTADLYRNDGTLNIANVAYDTKSGTLVYNGTATEVDGYSPSEAGAVSSLIASDSSGDVQLASGDLRTEHDSDTTYGVGVGKRFNIGIEGENNTIEHFDVGSMPSGWTWATYTNFVTPTVVTYGNSRLILGNISNSEKAFLYRTDTTLTVSTHILNFFNSQMNQSGSFVGLRLDDGTDSNWVEIGLVNAMAGSVQTQAAQVRDSSPTSNSGYALNYVPMVGMKFNIGGTTWTNWQATPLYMSMPFAGARPVWYATAPITGLSWTPTRWGIVIEAPSSGSATWHRWTIDAVGYNT